MRYSFSQRLNAPMSLIAKMEENSGVRFDDAAVALARQWLGPDEEERAYKVKIKSVEPSKVGVSGLSGTGGEPTVDKVMRIDVPKTVEEAAEIIRKFERGAPRADEAVADSISQHVQMDKTKLEDEKWLGTENEEKAS